MDDPIENEKAIEFQKLKLRQRHMGDFHLSVCEEKGAIISSDEKYRYILWRKWGNGPIVTFIMLNPSTADANNDDPTIRKCKGFAARWNCTEINVCNLYAYRATQPEELWRVDDPIGPDNEQHLFAACLNTYRRGGIIVCAWGVHGKRNDRGATLLKQLSPWSSRVRALRLTKDGIPGHPLYIPYEAPLIEIR